MDDFTIKGPISNNNNDLKTSEKEEDDNNERTSYRNLINDGILAGEKIAKLSVVTLLSIGVAELLMGQ